MKVNSIEWLQEARKLGATHSCIAGDYLYKIVDGELLCMDMECDDPDFGESAYTVEDLSDPACSFILIDFTPLDEHEAALIEDPVVVRVNAGEDPYKDSPYSEYFKSVSGLDDVDVYMVHKLFNIEDPSGAIHHASKKLLLSGVRTGNKPKHQDVKEARDTLNRWLEINKE